MGGIVASQLAERMPTKIKKIIFVSACIPQNGQSLEDIFQDHFGPLTYDKETMSIKIGKQLAVDDLINASFDDCSEEKKKLVRQKAVSEPIIPSLEKLSLSKSKYGAILKSYIKLNRDKVIPPVLQDKMVEAAGITEIVTMVTNHSPFFRAQKN